MLSFSYLPVILYFFFRSQNIVLDSLNAGLPYVGLPCQTQVNYIQNLLKFMDYCPMSGSLIYNIIVGRYFNNFF